MLGPRACLPVVLLHLFFLLHLVFAFASGPAAAQTSPPGETAGACCFAPDDCQVLAPEVCAQRGGTYRGDGSTCDPPLCVALSPVIGVNPQSLGFGTLCPGQCRDGEVVLRNAAPDPESQLVISELVITPPFSLVDPPGMPLTIPGDGTLVPLTLRYCASGMGPQIGALTIHASNAANSPLLVPLDGVADSPAVCDHGGPYFGLPGQPITFDGSGSTDPGGEIVSYAWDFGDGATATGAVVLHTYPLEGTYVVRLELTDDCGGVASCQTAAHVSTNLPPICDAGGPYSGDVGVPIAMSGAGSSDPDGIIVAYRWDFGDGQTAFGVTQHHTYSLSGTYTVTLTVVDDEAASSTCATTAHVIQDTPNMPPICDAGGPYSGIAGVPIAMSGAGSSDPDGVIVTYRWNFGDGQTGFGATQNHTYSLPNTYTVSLTVIDNQAASSTCTTTAHVLGDPNPPPICDAGGPYSGTVGQPILFDGSGSSDPNGTIVDYSWQFGDCETGTGPNPSHTYATAAAYTASLCVTDDGGQTSCCTAPVQVTGAPGPRADLPFGKGTSEVAGSNPYITLPLHAETDCGDCTLPIDCLGLRPTVNIQPHITTSIHLIAANFNALAAVQTAFEWDPGWVFLGAFFDCVPGQVTTVYPAPPGGATAGTVATAFNCMTGPNTLVIGRLLMISGPSGCLSQVQSSYPGGIHVLDCNSQGNHITSLALLGRICVASGGYDACVPVVPVRATTWGQVKATYR